MSGLTNLWMLRPSLAKKSEKWNEVLTTRSNGKFPNMELHFRSPILTIHFVIIVLSEIFGLKNWAKDQVASSRNF